MASAVAVEVEDDCTPSSSTLTDVVSTTHTSFHVAPTWYRSRLASREEGR